MSNIDNTIIETTIEPDTLTISIKDLKIGRASCRERVSSPV